MIDHLFSHTTIYHNVCTINEIILWRSKKQDHSRYIFGHSYSAGRVLFVVFVRQGIIVRTLDPSRTDGILSKQY